MYKKWLVGEVGEPQSNPFNDLEWSAAHLRAIEAIEQFLAETAPSSGPRRRAPKTPRVDVSPTITYFVSTLEAPDYPIKIGLSTRNGLLYRIQNLQNGCPYNLIVLKAVKGTDAPEKLLHRKFDESRMAGEWFCRTPELMDYITKAKPDEAFYRLPMEWIDWQHDPEMVARLDRAANAR